jgi:putative secretion ATPase (PEP-CTERM system associated)
MYEHFFNLKAEPFRLSPDHRFCYQHVQYSKAKAYMAYAFTRAEGFVMITGQPGTGKTTLIGDLVESLADENVVVANLVSTQLAADDLLRMVAFAFGLPAETTEKSTILQHLSARFLALHRGGGRALLIVDEAQDLTPKAMEELRLLTNLQQEGKPLLQIFLLGQPELRELIHDPALEQVHQRIIATSHLRALEEDETRAYVEHRLRVVGWQNDPAISKAVFPIIYQFSEGVPRRINLICSRLFLHSLVEQRHQIGVADARTVVQELQDEQLSKRNLLHQDLFYAQDEYEQPLPVAEQQAVTSIRASSKPRVRRVPVNAGIVESAGPEEPAQPAVTDVEVPESSLRVDPPVDSSASSPPEIRHSSSARFGGAALRSEAWMIALAALLAGALVAIMIWRDRFL